MSVAKTMKSEVKILKGQEAEDKVLEYLTRMNRPYGAVDVSSNLKGAVPKTAAQKILVSLTEKGELTQKIYGKTTFFVVNQAKIQKPSQDECEKMESELKIVEDETKELSSQVKALNAELSSLRNALTNEELDAQIADTTKQIQKVTEHLAPLRQGTALISAQELSDLDAEWIKWRMEWVRRRKIFLEFWGIVTDTKTRAEAEEYRDELGIELDSQEHSKLEMSTLCQAKQSNVLKRKR